MSEGFAHERFLADAAANLERLARGPGNAGALAGLRAVFAEARADAGPGPVAELARCAENLLSAQLEGHVSPTAEAAELVAQAARGLATLDAAARADLAERMDAVASGMSATALDPLPPQAPSRPEPPLLTEREDGVIVTPGMFGDPTPAAATAAQAEPLPQPVASSTVPPQPLPEPGPEAVADAAPVAADADAGAEPTPTARRAAPPAADAQAAIDGMAAALKNLERQIVALTTIASGDDAVSTAVQHTAGELAATAAELDRHNRTLAKRVNAGDEATDAPADTAPARAADAAATNDGASALPRADNPPTAVEPRTDATSTTDTTGPEEPDAPTSPDEPAAGNVQAHSLQEPAWIKLQGGRE